MNRLSFSIFHFLLLLLLLLLTRSVSAQTNHNEFLRCLHLRSNDVSLFVHTRNDSSFWSILDSTIQNRRFSAQETPKPLFVVTPQQVSHVQATIKCSRQHGLQIRIRSGGHDYEGLSYVAHLPFILLDLMNLRSIDIDVETRTAWVQSGATVGQLYYEIATSSNSLAFPAGVYPTVGIGGHFSGGGYGTLIRKYGLAVDHIIDAHLVDVRGRFLDRQAMGDDLFWAIRGGCGASFGVILAWKIKLVQVPPTVTIFKAEKTVEENATRIIHRWQYVADKLPKDLFVRVILKRSNSGGLVATFPSLYLGTVDEIMPLMDEKFPELGLKKKDCIEMSWIQSVLYFAGKSTGDSIQVLAERRTDTRSFKAKSDYVRDPLPESAFKEIWRRLEAPEAEVAKFILTPFGGRMSEISDSETPYPHRSGIIYEIQHLVYWKQEDNVESDKYISWVEELYEYVTPYVSKSPRAAYINFRDLDLGRNNEGRTSNEGASVWGVKYFKNNFDRLVKVKTMVDPTDFFRNEQSIPSLHFLNDV